MFADGGMLLDLAIGGQKFIFKPAAELAKAKPAEGGMEKEAAPSGGERERADEERPATSEQERPGHHPG